MGPGSQSAQVCTHADEYVMLIRSVGSHPQSGGQILGLFFLPQVTGRPAVLIAGLRTLGGCLLLLGQGDDFSFGHGCSPLSAAEGGASSG